MGFDLLEARLLLSGNPPESLAGEAAPTPPAQVFRIEPGVPATLVTQGLGQDRPATAEPPGAVTAPPITFRLDVTWATPGGPARVVAANDQILHVALTLDPASPPVAVVVAGAGPGSGELAQLVIHPRPMAALAPEGLPRPAGLPQSPAVEGEADDEPGDGEGGVQEGLAPFVDGPGSGGGGGPQGPSGGWSSHSGWYVEVFVVTPGDRDGSDPGDAPAAGPLIGPGPLPRSAHEPAGGAFAAGRPAEPAGRDDSTRVEMSLVRLLSPGRDPRLVAVPTLSVVPALLAGPATPELDAAGVPALPGRKFVAVTERADARGAGEEDLFQASIAMLPPVEGPGGPGGPSDAGAAHGEPDRSPWPGPVAGDGGGEGRSGRLDWGGRIVLGINGTATLVVGLSGPELSDAFHRLADRPTPAPRPRVLPRGEAPDPRRSATSPAARRARSARLAAGQAPGGDGGA